MNTKIECIKSKSFDKDRITSNFISFCTFVLFVILLFFVPYTINLYFYLYFSVCRHKANINLLLEFNKEMYHDISKLIVSFLLYFSVLSYLYTHRFVLKKFHQNIKIQIIIYMNIFPINDVVTELHNIVGNSFLYVDFNWNSLV